MSEIIYDKNKEIDEIQKGFEMFDVDNKGIIDPNEIKEAIEEMNLQDKNLFFYELICSLCKDKEIKKKGGMTCEDFISFLEKKTNDSESKDGIQRIFNVFSDGSNDMLPIPNFYQAAKEIGDTDNEKELKELIEKSQTGGKELNFDEFYEIMKKEEINKKDNKNGKKVNGIKVPKKEEIKTESTPGRYKRKKKEVKNSDNEEKEEKEVYNKKEIKEPDKEEGNGNSNHKKNYRYSREFKQSSEGPDSKSELVVVEQIITTEKVIEEGGDTLSKENNKEEEEAKPITKKYSYRRSKKPEVSNSTPVEELKEENKNDTNNEVKNSEENTLKRYKRRYRDSKQNDIETTTNVVTTTTTTTTRASGTYSSLRRRGKI